MRRTGRPLGIRQAPFDRTEDLEHLGCLEGAIAAPDRELTEDARLDQAWPECRSNWEGIRAVV